MREKYKSVAIELAKRYNYENISEHIIDIMCSVMMHRDKVQFGGSFAEAICNNNLDLACSCADNECIKYLRLFSLVKRFGHLNEK
jgi:hypothetical protein